MSIDDGMIGIAMYLSKERSLTLPEVARASRIEGAETSGGGRASFADSVAQLDNYQRLAREKTPVTVNGATQKLKRIRYVFRPKPIDST